MPPVGGRIEDDVLRPALYAALQRRLQRLVGGVVGVKRKIVAEQDEAMARIAQECHQLRQGLDVLAVNFDELQGLFRRLVHPGMHRLDQRALAHAARAPEKNVVRRESAGESLGILEKKITNPVDPFEKTKLYPIDFGDRL